MSQRKLQDERLQQIKQLLLDDDREYATTLAARVADLERTINQRPDLAIHVTPIIQDEINKFAREIPETLGPTITLTLKEEIANSKDAVVEAMYPILGQMIKKYLAAELKAISERVNARVQRNFTWKGIKSQLRSRVTGISPQEEALANEAKASISQVYVIEHGSGLLLGEYTPTAGIDSDMLSGMLTAIKAFAEDAISTEGQKLSAIDYDNYSLRLYNFHQYYIALALNNPLPEHMEGKFETEMLKLAELLNKGDIQDNLETSFTLGRFIKDLDLQKAL